ncbi:MAG: FecR family protein [Elusimicrobia bacterium]|nr:FecR family protein [Elusimicrobiota bacterium]
MKKILVLAILACWTAARAQQPGSDSPDYKQIMEDAMKSGKYGQGNSESWDARLKRVSGEVSVKPEGADEWSKIEGAMPLEKGDSVKTSSDGTAEIYLDDKGSMTLGRNTELEFVSVEKTESSFTLKAGSIAAKIQHFLNEKFKMQVKTPSAVCSVRGTEFAVEYSQLGKETSVAVYDEGKVAVNALDEKEEPGQEYLLEKNTELTFKASQKHFRPMPLAKMTRYRAGVILMRQRMKTLKKTWLPASQANRSALRDQALKRHIIRRQIKVKNGAKKHAVKAGASRKAKTKAKRPGPKTEPE